MRKKTQSKLGCISLFYDEDDDDVLLRTTDFCPQVFSTVDHKKNKGEHCYIKEYVDGWVIIEYAGCVISVPSQFVTRHKFNKVTPEPYKPIQQRRMITKIKRGKL